MDLGFELTETAEATFITVKCRMQNSNFSYQELAFKVLCACGESIDGVDHHRQRVVGLNGNNFN